MSGALRKIVQIIVSDAVLYALCSDGTIWERVHHGGGNFYWTLVDTSTITTSTAEVQP